MTDSYTLEDGQGLHALDENQQLRRGEGYGVVAPQNGDCAVSVNSQTLGQADTLSVAAGTVWVAGSQYSISTQAIGIDVADTSDPRRDVVYVDSSGNVQVAKGNAQPGEPVDPGIIRFEHFRPAPPDLNATDGTVLAEVWVPAGASSVTADDLRDRRIAAADAATFQGSPPSEFAKLADNETVTGSWTFDADMSMAVNDIDRVGNLYGEYATPLKIRTGGGGSAEINLVDQFNALSFVVFNEGGPTEFLNYDLQDDAGNVFYDQSAAHVPYERVEGGARVAASGTVTLSSGSAVVSTGITTTGTHIDVRLDPSGNGANSADVKAAARAFWDNSAGEYKVEILEDGTSVGNPDIGYKVIAD